jgi:phage shock protein PspC (stress-responsive transcriptional regulator)
MAKLVKSKNQSLFGVCGGIAQWSGIDVTLVRIAFVLGAIFSGSLVFWAYLLLAIILPNEE